MKHLVDSPEAVEARIFRVTDKIAKTAEQQEDERMVRDLAPHVTDEAHLNEILSEIPDPAMRMAVRETIRPYLAFELEPLTELRGVIES